MRCCNSPVKNRRFVNNRYFAETLCVGWGNSPLMAFVMVVSLVMLMSIAPNAQANEPSPQTKPAVVATIKPLAMLVKAVAGDTVTIDVLIDGNQSPHDYALKFSDLRKVHQAALVVWVGPQLESQLQKSLQDHRNLLTLSALFTDFGEEAGHPSSPHEHDHHDNDPHYWLDPVAVIEIAQQIHVHIQGILPDKKAKIDSNLQDFVDKLQKIDVLMESELDAFNGRGFLVMHDGYSRFVNHYHLNQLGSVKRSDGAQQGVKHYGDLVNVTSKVYCVFSEPQWSHKPAVQLSRHLHSKVVMIDPLGIDQKLTKSAFLQFFDTFGRSFKTCLRDGQ